LKLRLFLVFIIIYIIAVFGWWLYSFIDYAKKEYKLEYNNLRLNAQVIKTKITEFIDFKQRDKSMSPYKTYLEHRQEIKNLHSDLNKNFGIKTNLSLSDTTGTLFHMISISIHESEFRAIEKNFLKKQRAFYSEVIFFTILVISGVVWVFRRLESLLNLNKMQNNFLLSITHEFKTPLTAIKLSAQTLQHRKMDEQTQQHLIQQTVNNSDRLNELLDNVLLATRIDGNSYQFDMSSIDITMLIRKTADLLLAEPYFKGSFIFDEGPKIIIGDEVSLKLVFSNLFQNAIKYAGNESEIKVSYSQVNGQFMISVSDNGKGMDPREYKAIFKKFYRIGDENTRESKGTGLGLFLVKQILTFHKATIKAEGNKPNGTKFNIIFKSN
jgi:two-component system phosphate regulon sensor histidine kinase PhoR